jgi:hypothetical protein
VFWPAAIAKLSIATCWLISMLFLVRQGVRLVQIFTRSRVTAAKAIRLTCSAARDLAVFRQNSAPKQSRRLDLANIIPVMPSILAERSRPSVIFVNALEPQMLGVGCLQMRRPMGLKCRFRSVTRKGLVPNLGIGAGSDGAVPRLRQLHERLLQQHGQGSRQGHRPALRLYRQMVPRVKHKVWSRHWHNPAQSVSGTA